MKDKLDKKDNYLSYVYLLSCFYHRKINKIIQNKKDKIDKNKYQDKKKILNNNRMLMKKIFKKMKMFYFLLYRINVHIITETFGILCCPMRQGTTNTGFFIQQHRRNRIRPNHIHFFSNTDILIIFFSKIKQFIS